MGKVNLSLSPSSMHPVVGIFFFQQHDSCTSTKALSPVGDSLNWSSLTEHSYSAMLVTSCHVPLGMLGLDSLFFVLSQPGTDIFVPLSPTYILESACQVPQTSSSGFREN